MDTWVSHRRGLIRSHQGPARSRLRTLELPHAVGHGPQTNRAQSARHHRVHSVHEGRGRHRPRRLLSAHPSAAGRRGAPQQDPWLHRQSGRVAAGLPWIPPLPRRSRGRGPRRSAGNAARPPRTGRGRRRRCAPAARGGDPPRRAGSIRCERPAAHRRYFCRTVV